MQISKTAESVVHGMASGQGYLVILLLSSLRWCLHLPPDPGVFEQHSVRHGQQREPHRVGEHVRGVQEEQPDEPKHHRRARFPPLAQGEVQTVQGYVPSLEMNRDFLHEQSQRRDEDFVVHLQLFSGSCECLQSTVDAVQLYEGWSWRRSYTWKHTEINAKTKISNTFVDTFAASQPVHRNHLTNEERNSTKCTCL